MLAVTLNHGVESSSLSGPTRAKASDSVTQIKVRIFLSVIIVSGIFQ